jgi:hypothetical protein
VPLLDCLAVGLEGLQKLHLVVILVEPVEERSYFGLVSVDAVLDQFFLVQSPEAGECDLVEEAAPFLFAFPRLHFCHQLVAVEAGQLLLLGVAQLHHPPHQLVLLDPQIAVQLQQRVVPCPYELLQGDARLSRVDRSFKQEQNYQLRLDVKRELLDLRVVDLVEAQQAVVVVDGVESVHEFIDESVAEVELEGGEHVEVGPGVEVKADLELLFVDDALLVEVVEQSVEYLQLLQLETQILAHHRPLPNALVAALNLTQVLPESRNTYLTVLAATFYDFLPLRLTKLSTMKASLLMIRSQIPALYASSYSAPNYTSLKMLFSVF